MATDITSIINTKIADNIVKAIKEVDVRDTLHSMKTYVDEKSLEFVDGNTVLKISNQAFDTSKNTIPSDVVLADGDKVTDIARIKCTNGVAWFEWDTSITPAEWNFLNFEKMTTIALPTNTKQNGCVLMDVGFGVLRWCVGLNSKFTGNGITKAYSLPNNTVVYYFLIFINGIKQNEETYSYHHNKLHFNNAPDDEALIEIFAYNWIA